MDPIWANCRQACTRAITSTDCPNFRQADNCAANCANTNPTANRGRRSRPNNWWRWRRNSAKSSTCPSLNGRNFLPHSRWRKLRWKFGSKTGALKPNDSKRPNWKNWEWRHGVLSVTWCHLAPPSAFSVRVVCRDCTDLEPDPVVRLLQTQVGLTATHNLCHWWAHLHRSIRQEPLWPVPVVARSVTTTQ